MSLILKLKKHTLLKKRGIEELQAWVSHAGCLLVWAKYSYSKSFLVNLSSTCWWEPLWLGNELAFPTILNKEINTTFCRKRNDPLFFSPTHSLSDSLHSQMCQIKTNKYVIIYDIFTLSFYFYFSNFLYIFTFFNYIINSLNLFITPIDYLVQVLHINLISFK